VATKKDNEAKPRFIYELARELGVRSSELRSTIKDWGLGWDVSSHMKKLSPGQITEMHTRLAGDDAAEEAPKKAPAKRGSRSKSSRKAKPAAAAAENVATEEKPTKKAKKPEPAKAPKADKPAKAKKAPKAAKAPKAEVTSEEAPSKPRRTRPSKAKKAAEAKATEDAPAEKKAPSIAKRGKKKSDAPVADVEVTEKKAKKPSKKGKKAEEEAVSTSQAAPAEKPAKKSRRPERREDVVVEDADKKVKEWLLTVLKGMGYARPRIVVEELKDVIEANVSGAGITELIGQTNAAASTKLLEALQLMATKAVFPHGTKVKNVIIDVAGFRKGRIEALAAAAERAAAYVRASGKPLRFTAMNAFDRRAFHTTLRKESGLWSESEGYGVFRQLRVKVAKPAKSERKPRREEPKPEAAPADEKSE